MPVRVFTAPVWRLIPLICTLIPGAFAQDTSDEQTGSLDFARIDSGTSVVAVSEGCNLPPYDVKAALGEGSHCSYPQSPPNWFVLDLGQMRRIQAIEIDWRYNDKSPDEFILSFGLKQDALERSIEARGIGGKGKYWYRVLEEPVKARFVKMEVLSLTNIQWTVINRFSLYGTSRIPRLIDHCANRYAELRRRMNALTAEADAHALDLSDTVRETHETVERTDALLRSNSPISQEDWERIQVTYLDLLQAAYDAESFITFGIGRATRNDTPFWVATTDGMTRAFRHIWPSATSRELSLSCARNEWESGQIVIGAPTSPLSGVELTWTPLKGPATLPAEALDVQLVCYLKTEAAPYPTHHIGWWPDGLSPVGPFSLSTGEVQPLWITAKIPPDAPPGVYTSTLSVTPDSIPPRQIDISVTVWDFALPTRISLPNIFSLSKLLVEAWYRRDRLTWDDLKQTYYDFWLDRRLNPTSLYGVKLPPPEDLDYCLERGMNTFILEYVYNRHVREEEKFQVLMDKLGAWDPILRSKKLHDKAMVYLADEPADKKDVTEEINRRAATIGERFPAMRRFLVLTRPVDLAFEGNVDVWCPIVSAMRPEDVAAAHDRGEECWWYTVGNFYGLDRPLAESRTMPWLTWQHDLDGILLWLLQSSWRGRNKPGRFRPTPGQTMWPSFEVAGHAGHNGIGNLCYPGPDGRPWSSIRLEILRESMEDYEYFALLKQALKDTPGDPAAELLDLPEQLAVEYEVGESGRFMLDHRQKLGEALHRLAGTETVESHVP